jgi:hypothetical protein
VETGIEPDSRDQARGNDEGRLSAALVVESEVASPRGFEPRCPP